MGLYASPPPFAGGVWPALSNGDQATLLNGAETVATGSASYAVSMAYSPNGSSAKTFNVSGCKAGTVIQIEAAGADVAGDYTVVSTINPDANGNGAYTDTGASPYYRAYVQTFAAGDAPVVTVTRS